MTTYRYPPSSLVADYGRGIAGAAVSAGGFALVPSGSVMAFVFAGLTALFLLFTIRTALRQRTRVALTERSITSGPGRERSLDWNDIQEIKLRYYSTRRARDRGWMTLRLGSEGRSIVVESGLDGFEAILAQAAAAARRNRLELSPTTRANFAMLGFPIEGPSAAYPDPAAPKAPLTSQGNRSAGRGR